MTTPLRSYAGRFVLPLLLLMVAFVTWTVASRLGETDLVATTSSQPDGLDVPLASAARVPELMMDRFTTNAVETAIAGLPPVPGGRSCTQLVVDGEPLVDSRSDVGLVPAYAQLAITGHGAIEILGPDYRFETELMSVEAPDANGVLGGGLFVIGGGDPVIMTRDYAASLRPTLSTRTALEDFASVLAGAGVTRIEGGVVGDDGRYDAQRLISGWPQSLLSEGLVGPLTALQINDAFVSAPQSGQDGVASDVPAAHAAAQISQALVASGIDVAGEPRWLGTESLPSLVPLATVRSAPLGEIVQQMLATNDASAAELIVKELGVASEESGTTQAGARAIQAILQAQGIETLVPFRDGSGLGPIGGTTCAQLVETLDSLPDGHPTLAVLPNVNLPGVFGGRFAGLDQQVDLRLVGGVQGDASGFVARTVDPDGPTITVASIINRSGGPTVADLGFQQALVEVVDTLWSSVSVEASAE